MLEEIREISPNTIKWGIALAGVAAVAGPLAVGIGVLTQAVLAFGAAAGTAAAVATGGLSIALAGLAVWWAKTRLDALDATDAVDKFADSLRKMSGEALLATESKIMAKRLEVWNSIENLQGGRGNEGRIRALQEQWHTLGESLNTVRERMKEMQTLPGVVVTAITNPVSTAADEAKRLADNLAEAIRQAGAMPAPNLALSREDQARADLGESTRAAHEASQRRLTRFADLGGTLQGVTVPKVPGSVVPGEKGGGGILGSIGGALKGAAGEMGSQIMGMAAKFGPLAAVAAALKPVFEGLMEGLSPVLNALAEPLKTVGRLIAILLVPSLQLLQPILDAVAWAFSWVLTTVGWLVKGLGAFIDKIAGWLTDIGDKMERWGQGVIDDAKAAREGTLATNEALEKFGSSLLNYARVVHINRLRHNLAGLGVTSGGGSTGPGGTHTGPGGPGEHMESIRGFGLGGGGHTFNLYGSDPRTVAGEVIRLLGQPARRGGVTNIRLGTT